MSNSVTSPTTSIDSIIKQYEQAILRNQYDYETTITELDLEFNDIRDVISYNEDIGFGICLDYDYAVSIARKKRRMSNIIACHKFLNKYRNNENIFNYIITISSNERKDCLIPDVFITDDTEIDYTSLYAKLANSDINMSEAINCIEFAKIHFTELFEDQLFDDNTSYFIDLFNRLNPMVELAIHFTSTETLKSIMKRRGQFDILMYIQTELLMRE